MKNRISYMAALLVAVLSLTSCTGGSVQSEDEAVDLGLSVKWASWNIGASSPGEAGDYFAWGETSPKDFYYWNTYKWIKPDDYQWWSGDKDDIESCWKDDADHAKK